jgi:DNA-binding beta-propeller fold protein YncE
MALFALIQSQAAESSRGFLLVANKGDRTLSVVDTEKNVQIAAIPENGITGHEVAASTDGKRAFVPIYGNSGVGQPGTDGRLLRVIDLASREIVGTVDFGKGVRPHCAIYHPKTGLLYVTTEIENAIAVIDPKTLKIVGSIPTGQPESHMLAISSDARRGYTANVGPGTVSVIDIPAKKVLKVIPISKNTQRIAISVDDRWVFTSDQTKPQLAVIDTQSNELKQWVPLPAKGYGTAATPDGKFLVIAMPAANQVGLLNLGSMKIEKTISVPKAPQEVLIRPDGAIAYVSCDSSKKVAAINLHSWEVDALIDTGRGTDGLAWAPVQ